MLIPLFGLQLVLTIYRPEPNTAWIKEYEYVTFIITNSQVRCSTHSQGAALTHRVQHTLTGCSTHSQGAALTHRVQHTLTSAAHTHRVQHTLTRCSTHSQGAAHTHRVQHPPTRCSTHSQCTPCFSSECNFINSQVVYITHVQVECAPCRSTSAHWSTLLSLCPARRLTLCPTRPPPNPGPRSALPVPALRRLS